MPSRNLAKALNNAVKPLFKKRGFIEQRIFTDWPHIVGERLSSYSHPQKLRQLKSGTTLYVELYDSALSTEYSYQIPLILEKLALYFGHQTITTIKLIHRPHPIKVEEAKPTPKPLSKEKKAELDKALEQIEDEALKANLFKLGTNIGASYQ